MEKVYYHPFEDNSSIEIPNSKNGNIVDMKKFKEADHLKEISKLKEACDSYQKLFIQMGVVRGEIQKDFLLDYMQKKILIIWKVVNGTQSIIVPGFILDYRIPNPNNSKMEISKVEPIEKNDILINLIQKQFPNLPINFW